jgi:hypothetical protein
MDQERNELFSKLLELEKRLATVKASKKAMAKDYNDQIKDIQSEIKETVDELGE